MEDTIESALESATGLKWTVSTPGVGMYRAYCSPYVVEVEARNPKEDNTWTLSFEDQHSGSESKLGPIQTKNIERELEAFVEDALN